MLADLVYPAEVVGRRIRVKLDGKRIMKVHLDKTQQTNVEHKVSTVHFTSEYIFRYMRKKINCICVEKSTLLLGFFLLLVVFYLDSLTQLWVTFFERKIWCGILNMFLFVFVSWTIEFTLIAVHLNMWLHCLNLSERESSC